MSDDAQQSARKPWERRPEETDAQWQGFKTYRDLGLSRSLRKAWKEYKADRGLKQDWPAAHFKEWSAANDWTDRAEAYDRHVDENHRAAILETQRQAMEELLEGATRAAAILCVVATGQDGDLELGDVDRQQMRAIQRLLDRCGVDTPDEINIGGQIDVTSDERALGETKRQLEQLSDEELLDEIDRLASILDEGDDGD